MGEGQGSGPEDSGTVRDRQGYGTWRVAPGRLESALWDRGQVGGVVLLAVAWVLCFAVVVICVVPLLQAPDVRPVGAALVGMGGFLTVLLSLLLWHLAMQLRPRVRVDAAGVRLGPGLGKRAFTWQELRSLRVRPAGQQTAYVDFCRRPRRAGGRVPADRALVAAPVVDALLQDATRRGLGVETPGARPRR